MSHALLKETSDLGLAAALVCLEYRLVNVDRKNPKKVIFQFARDGTSIEQIEKEYLYDTVMVPARKYFDTLKSLKSAIYSE